jgi:3-methyl-2-oxobutanoate hydroxymethyltransferase
MNRYVGYLRRFPGGHGYKTPKNLSLPAVPTDTSSTNFGSYFAKFSKYRTAWITRGFTSYATEVCRANPLVELVLSRRGFASQPDAPPTDAASLSASGGGDETIPLYGTRNVNPAESKKSGPVTITTLRQHHRQGRPISMVTAYDYPTSRIADKAGVDMILVGDSLGMVVLGYSSTVPVTMEDMLHHCKAANRGRDRAYLVGDLPFGSYLTPGDAVRNAARLVQEGGVDAVKLEGGVRVLPQIQAIIAAGISVVGHVGLTPQTAASLGGFKVQGKSSAAAVEVLNDAQALQAAGVFALVLEVVPAPVAAHITNVLDIPTIGIGAGQGCSGQVLVFHDLVGMYDQFTPKFSKQYLSANHSLTNAVASFHQEVKDQTFPTSQHEFSMNPTAFKNFLDAATAQNHNASGAQTDSRSRSCTLSTRATPRRGGRFLSHTSSRSVNLRRFSSHASPSPGLDSCLQWDLQDSWLDTLGLGSFCTARLHGAQSQVNTQRKAGGSLANLTSNLDYKALLRHSFGLGVMSAANGFSRTFSGAQSQFQAPNQNKCVDDIPVYPGMHVVSDIVSLRQLRSKLLASSRSGSSSKPYKLGFVPTMGALHEGHLSLVRAAQTHCEHVVVSIFVNPLQFAAHEDLGTYPRPLTRDLELLHELGVDVVFNPQVNDLYPHGRENFSLRVQVGDTDSKPEGASRPGFFTGVATVVSKLFNIVQCDAAFFWTKRWSAMCGYSAISTRYGFPIRDVHLPYCSRS